ncbi:hypothetical protein, partial [Cellulomonas sp.]|uniref:hypothetical protein n=1 Tax=Cellulomonas sp. TaxID=40001 RepID=UPI002D235626
TGSASPGGAVSPTAPVRAASAAGPRPGGTSAPARPSAPAASPLPTGRGVPARLLLRAEARRQRRDRSLRAVAAAAVASAAGLAVLSGLRAPVGDVRFALLLHAALSPLVLLAPVAGALAVTTLWSRGVMGVTIAHEPRRLRVLAATVTVAAGTAVLLALAAVGAVAVAAFARHYPGAPGWAPTAAGALDAVGEVALLVLAGAAAGAALRGAPRALAALAVAPALVTSLAHAAPVLARSVGWVDLAAALGPLARGAAPGPGQWAHLATAAGAWVVVPLLVGAVRLVRGDVR